MAEKIATLGVQREANYMYYLKRGEVWRVARKEPGLPKRGPERVAANPGIDQDADYIYFLDKDGDIARARRAVSSHALAEEQDDDEVSQETSQVLGERDAYGADLIYRLPDDITIPASSVHIALVQEAVGKLFEQAVAIGTLEHLTPRELEEVLAELLRREGFEAILTPQTRDGGRDVVAIKPGPLPMVVLAEAKKMRLVPPALVHSLEAVRQRDRAHVGLLATTGRFSLATRAEATKHWARWIELRDGAELIAWMRARAKR